MDGKAFDSWTRRRLNVAMGSAGVGVLLGVLASADVEGKPKKKKKKTKKKETCAKKPGDRCTSKIPCCKGKGFVCLPDISNPAGTTRCCKTGLQSCSVDEDCCGVTCTDGACACKSNGQQCGGIGSVCCSLKCVGEGEDAVCAP